MNKKDVHTLHIFLVWQVGACVLEIGTVSNTYEKHKKKGEAYCVPSWVAWFPYPLVSPSLPVFPNHGHGRWRGIGVVVWQWWCVGRSKGSGV